jgi:hypothetical protein
VLRLLGITLALGLAVITLVAWVPLPVPAGMDFSMIYIAVLGLRHGVHLYDPAGQAALFGSVLGRSPDSLNLPMYVYPPWYAWSTWYLGWLPIQQAARLWFLMNLGMLMAAVSLMTSGWPWALRRWAFPAAFLFLPALGILVVGQYTIPVLLGAALCLYGWEKKSSWLLVVGLLLLTFKPHVGGLPLVATFVWLFFRKDSWTRGALFRTAAGMAGLAGLCFLFDPDWLRHYLGVLTGFRSLATYAACEDCASLSTLLVGLVTGRADTGWSLWFGLALLPVMGAIIVKRGLYKELPSFLSAAILAGLLANPYLMNYDYVLLLIPLAAIVHSRTTWHRWVAVAATIALPWSGLALAARPGTSAALVVSALIVFTLLPGPDREVGNPAGEET